LNGELSTHTHNNVTLTQPDVKKQDVFIKKEYLPAPNKLLKIEKSRDDVTRMLNFVNPPAEVVTVAPALPPLTNKSGIIVKNETQMLQPKIEVEPTVEVAVKVDPPLPAVMPEEPLPPPPPSPAKEVKADDKKDRPIKVETSTAKTSSSSSSSSSKTSSSSSHRHSSSSSSHHKSNHHSSSSHKSGSSSHRDCSRCYKRSKIKHANIGIQCRRDSNSGKSLPSATVTTATDITASTARIPTINRELNTVSRTSPLALASGLENLKYSRFFHIEVHPNGGASFVHMYQDEIAGLNDEEMDELVDEYFQVVFSEDGNGFANHVMGIVHDAAAYLPDLLEHMAENYPNLTVKAGVLGRNSDIETSTMTQYNEQVRRIKVLWLLASVSQHFFVFHFKVVKNYAHGTVRYGPLHQISLVGKVHEEVGGYFPDLLARLEANKFLNRVSFKR
jgi:lysine-specific demethylase 9